MEKVEIDATAREVDETLAHATGLPADAERLLTPYSGNDAAFYRTRREQNTLDAAYYGTILPASASLIVGATGLGLALNGVHYLILGYSQIGARALAALAFLASVALVYRFWRSLPEEFRGRKSPGFVAVLYLVPIFNAIWYFQAVSAGGRRGLAALESLERNRLRFKSPVGSSYAAWGCWCVAFFLTAGLFLNSEFRAEVGLDDVWRSIVGLQDFFASSMEMTWVAINNIVAFALVVFGAGFYALTLGRMKEIAERLLALRLEADAEPFATEESRAKSREELDRILNSPTSR